MGKKSGKQKNNFRVSGTERWGFILFMCGTGMINTFVGSFLQMYMTDVGIAAVAIGIVFMVARVWDAVNDPIFGILVDKLHLKNGKFLPFIRFGNFLLPVATILLFAIPNGLSPGWKLLWAFVAYLLYDVAYTMCDVPSYAMTSVMTDQVQERVSIMSGATVMGGIMMLVVMIAGPQLYPTIGALPTVTIIAVAAGVLMIFMSRTAKERFINKDENEVTLRDMAKYVKDNKYLRIGFLGIMVLSLTSMTNAMLNYFAVNCLGDLGVASVISVIIALPSLGVAIVLPVLTKRFDKFHILMVGVVGQMIMCVVCFLAGYENVPLFLGLMTVRSIFFGIQLVLQIQFTGDFVEYGEYITGKRLQGTAYAIQTFVFKFMNAVPGSLAMILLGMFGFVSGEGATQPQSAVDAIWVLFILSPVAGALISLPIFARYKLRDRTVQIMADANSGVITHEEAEKQLAGKI